MFGSLVRNLFGGAEQPARKPAGRDVSVADILSVSSPVLRSLFEQRYRNGVPPDHAAANQQAADAYAAAFADDPLQIAIELLVRAPLMVMLNNRENSNGSRCLKVVFDGALGHARTELVGRYGRNIPIDDRRLPLVLQSMGVLVAQGTQDLYWGYGLWLEPIVETAANRTDPEVRRSLIDMFDSFFAGDSHMHSAARTVAEKLLPLSGLPRSAIRALVESDAAAGSYDSIRERVLADAGEPLGAAIAAVLDGDAAMNSYSLRDAEKNPALRALCDLDPAGRGEAFSRMLDILDRRDSYGIDRWGKLERRNGQYVHGIQHQEVLRGFGSILGALASRKIELPAPDDDASRFLGRLRGFVNLNHKRVRDTILGVAKAHPDGKTAAALRKIAADRGGYHSYSEWIPDIEDMLRELPQSAAPAPVRTAPASVPSTGFGRKGLAQPTAQPEPAAIPGLTPIALPEFAVNDWMSRGSIGRHYDNIFDVRLYDAAHRNYLAKLAALADEIDGLPAPDLRTKAEGIVAATKRHGLKLTGDGDPFRTASVIEHCAQVGRELQARAALFEPFVTKHPEQARTIGKLAAGISSKSAPTEKWMAEAREAIGVLPLEQRRALIQSAIDAPTPSSDSCIGDHHLRSLIYLAADLDPADIGPTLADYALRKCYVTQPNIGIRSEKLGNACVWALAAMKDGGGVPYLARILARTKYPKIRARIDEKLNHAAEAAGLSRGALDELTVPDHGLDRDGTLRTPIGGGEAVIRVLGARDVQIDWLGEGGKLLKSPSVAMKAEKELVKEIRDTAKEIEADLGTQLVRLQRIYLEDRSWDAAEWRERYLDHPLVRTLARRLIWWVDADGKSTSAMPGEAGEHMLDAKGEPVSLDGARIRLWHPIDAEVAEVEAWRDRLEQTETTQPFAQAWREVYAVTDAERATNTYTNRWAAHILKQHQAMTLARLNGWRVTHRMWVDAPNDEPWHLIIPAHNLVADFWVEGAGGENPEHLDSGAYAYVATDRVQFHRIDEGARDSARGPAREMPLPLTELPPVVFSEVMRHTDLFTAVASIAADPNWLDRGGEAAHPSQWAHAAAVYWTKVNGAELEESGKRRRAMLQRIVPRLKIADKLSLDDRYLLVQGKRHKYKVHLGSGACFRGERHICIVPKAADEKQRLWLPFEGDRTLSIILSKALLLAADDKITDPVILRQL